MQNKIQTISYWFSIYHMKQVSHIVMKVYHDIKKYWYICQLYDYIPHHLSMVLILFYVLKIRRLER